MIYKNLQQTDHEIYNIIQKELYRQQNHIELIASENFVSESVMEAAGSILTNKYAEGYPHKRYYGGCEYVDEIEVIAQERLKKLFNCEYVNVQPHSGSQANQAVFMAFLKPGDTVLGMSLDCGGHLTHGAKKNQSGLWFNFQHYVVDKDTFLIDYDEIERMAIGCKPKLIIAGFSAYSRQINWKRFREIADAVDAKLMIDMAHVAGLVATGLYPNPIPYADVVTSTTHKTLRGPRGGVILCKDKQYEKELNSAIFPGLQGGPLMHIIAAKAVAFGEALKPEFKIYQQNVLKNSKALAKSLIDNKINVLTDGTDNHIVLVDLRANNINGKLLESELNKVGIVCNKNGIPFDPLPPVKTSGIRLGSPACTSRGFGEKEFTLIGKLISEAIFDLEMGIQSNREELSMQIREKIDNDIKKLCNEFKLY